MSRLKVDNIETRSGNNVTMDNALQLKSYTTAERDALSVSAGDIIYNTTANRPEYYDGSAWQSMQDPAFEVDYLVIAGGGGGGGSTPGNYEGGGGGGAGGYKNSYASESSGDNTANLSAENVVADGTNYTVIVGAGGSYGNQARGNKGNTSQFASITAEGGGGGGSDTYHSQQNGGTGGSGGGGGAYDGSGATGTTNQGGDGGNGTSWSAGGGGGAGGNGGNASQQTGGVGGNGLQSSITGTPIYRGGGGGGGSFGTSSPSNPSHGGGTGGRNGTAPTSGTIYTGGGGGGAGRSQGTGASGGKGVVILRYPAGKTISLTNGATSTAGEQTDGSTGYKYIQIETSGTVSWS